ncbi:GNAT family N-acetyltransferase [Thalassobacillus pellis]|uniref:GNAT family N-acetyltransferase n=1 Tax=Thalassobacillus pellis TaxID=748008 RepID=UPI001960B195|nr:GNAT family N-acetyltransferase [Thalassobacillus pellis]MBM7553123.1 ribosomal protein S18 acetylase RimI-like enzyme [Thalassobacillus pellis]
MDIRIRDTHVINVIQLKKLYEDVGWSAYTEDMPRLERGINNSLKVLSAWHNQDLIGLIRVIGDGETIIYIQDILVQEKYQNNGIGSLLLDEVLSIYNGVRQIVLLTDDSESVRAFYEKHDFKSCDQGDLVAFVKLTNLPR